MASLGEACTVLGLYDVMDISFRPCYASVSILHRIRLLRCICVQDALFQGMMLHQGSSLLDVLLAHSTLFMISTARVAVRDLSGFNRIFGLEYNIDCAPQHKANAISHAHRFNAATLA